MTIRQSAKRMIASYKKLIKDNAFPEHRTYYQFAIVLCENLLGERRSMVYPGDPDWPFPSSSEGEKVE